jgi:hypothetical protein
MTEAIYKEIADKTFSFGCNIKVENQNWETTIKVGHLTRKFEDNIYIYAHWDILWNNFFILSKIIWHDVMIWDVLDYKEKNKITKYEKIDWQIFTYNDEIMDLWKYKRLPIEKQSDDCIKFVFDLLPKN